MQKLLTLAMTVDDDGKGATQKCVEYKADKG